MKGPSPVRDLLGFDLAFGRELAGVDEAGRGPLAGPLVAAAAVLDLSVPYPGVDDSKLLTPEGREAAEIIIKERALAWAVAVKSPAEVDELNPLRCSMLAMAEAYAAMGLKPGLVLADGNTRPPIAGAHVECVVKGDSRSLTIAAASVLAKTARDRMMVELHSLYPQYGFDRHKGYGTREHLEALARHGPSPVHRLSYRGVLPEGSPGAKPARPGPGGRGGPGGPGGRGGGGGGSGPGRTGPGGGPGGGRGGGSGGAPGGGGSGGPTGGLF
jgi:ribonuclease HII